VGLGELLRRDFYPRAGCRFRNEPTFLKPQFVVNFGFDPAFDQALL
jgi:hypothetical protein